jgi:hypothetical protein
MSLDARYPTLFVDLFNCRRAGDGLGCSRRYDETSSGVQVANKCGIVLIYNLQPVLHEPKRTFPIPPSPITMIKEGSVKGLRKSVEKSSQPSCQINIQAWTWISFKPALRVRLEKARLFTGESKRYTEYGIARYDAQTLKYRSFSHVSSLLSRD